MFRLVEGRCSSSWECNRNEMAPQANQRCPRSQLPLAQSCGPVDDARLGRTGHRPRCHSPVRGGGHARTSRELRRRLVCTMVVARRSVRPWRRPPALIRSPSEVELERVRLARVRPDASRVLFPRLRPELLIACTGAWRQAAPHRRGELFPAIRLAQQLEPVGVDLFPTGKRIFVAGGQQHCEVWPQF